MHQVNHSKESVIVKYELCYLSRSTCLTAHVDALVRQKSDVIYHTWTRKCGATLAVIGLTFKQYKTAFHVPTCVLMLLLRY